MSTAQNNTNLHTQEHRLGYLLKRAQHALRLYMDGRLDGLGITTPQYNVLSAIEQDPGISNAALARGAFVTAQSMVGTMATLERLGLVRRTPDPDHGRVQKSRLTRKGNLLLQKAHVALAQVEDTMTAGFSAVQQTQFRAALQGCIGNLSNPTKSLRSTDHSVGPGAGPP